MRTIRPKGTLIPIGGGEDKHHEKNILCRVIEETGKSKPKICLITVASSVPEEVAQDYREAFKALGVSNLSVIHFTAHKDADTSANIKAVANCDAVMMSGGDQLRLSSLLGGTAIMDQIIHRYYDEPSFVVAGSSAGAAAMSNTMIVSGSSQDAMMKGSLQLTNGLGLITHALVDTHFTQRGRFGRIVQTIIGNPGVIGLGLGEDTGMVIHKGDVMEVIGSGLVVIIDGSTINYTDLTEICDSEIITVEGVTMHMLGPRKKFSLVKRKLIQNSKQQ